MIRTKDQFDAICKSEQKERERRAIAYAAKMGSVETRAPCVVPIYTVPPSGASGVPGLVPDETGQLVTKFDRNAYQRAYMRRKRAKEKE